MKVTLGILAVFTSLMFAGCSDSSHPLVSGTAVTGTVWLHSLRLNAAENSGGDIPKDAQVDVYENFIIIHNADGSRQIVSMDYVSNLRLK